MAKEHLPHDAAYKQFFRNRDMVASLLRSFVPESFIADLDFATLEPYPTAHVTDDFRERHNDIVWRARWKDTDVYLLLGRQIAPGRHAPARVPSGAVQRHSGVDGSPGGV